MPAKSKAQARAMFAAAKGNSTIGISKDVGQDFVDSTHGYKRLPEKLVSLAKKRSKLIAP